MTRRVVIQDYVIGESRHHGLRLAEYDGDTFVGTVRTPEECPDILGAARRFCAINGIEAPVTRVVQVVKP